MVIILTILSSLWLPNHSLPGALSSQVSWLCVKGHQMFSLHLQEQKQDGQKRWTTTNFPWTWHQNLWVTQWDECVCVHAKSLPLCQTLCDPMTVDHQAPLSMGFPSQEHWNELPCPSFSRGCSWPRDPTQVSCIEADSLPLAPPGKSSQWDKDNLIWMMMYAHFWVNFSCMKGSQKGGTAIKQEVIRLRWL